MHAPAGLSPSGRPRLGRAGRIPVSGRGREGHAVRGERPAPRRRIAALLSIACLVGALISVGFSIIRGDAWRLPLVLVAVAVAVVGLWYALSRRGAASVMGMLLAGAGLVTVAVVTLSADHRGVPLAVAIALILISASAARYALHRDLPGAAELGTVMPRPNHPVLIINTRSGGGKAEKYHLVDECTARGIEPIVLQPGDDLQQLASDAIARGADVIGMAGGDGSQALVATVAAAHDIPHVCVPAGTRNHFALDLGLDREAVVGALDAFEVGVERRIDLARVNGRVFVNNATMGLYAKIVQSQAYRDAKLKTAADMLPDMIGPKAEPFDLRFSDPDGAEYPTAHLLLVSNNPYELASLGGVGDPRPHGSRQAGGSRGPDCWPEGCGDLCRSGGGRADPELLGVARMGHS